MNPEIIALAQRLQALETDTDFRGEPFQREIERLYANAENDRERNVLLKMSAALQKLDIGLLEVRGGNVELARKAWRKMYELMLIGEAMSQKGFDHNKMVDVVVREIEAGRLKLGEPLEELIEMGFVERDWFDYKPKGS